MVLPVTSGEERFMALSARPMGLPSVPGAATGQVPSIGRGYTAASSSPISEISVNAEVHPDANFSFYDFADWMQHRSNTEADGLANPVSQFEVNSTTFVSLLNQYQSDIEKHTSTEVSKRSFQSNLSRAIRAYEGTASVIHGQSAKMGEGLSISL